MEGRPRLLGETAGGGVALFRSFVPFFKMPFGVAVRLVSSGSDDCFGGRPRRFGAELSSCWTGLEVLVFLVGVPFDSAASLACFRVKLYRGASLLVDLCGLPEAGVLALESLPIVEVSPILTLFAGCWAAILVSAAAAALRFSGGMLTKREREGNLRKRR